MYSRPPGSLKPQSNGKMAYVIIIIICVILCIISSVVAFFYFKSSKSTGSSTGPKETLNLCDSRLNNGVCPEILNNINGKLCFATFNSDTGEYVLTAPNKTKVWSNGYVAPKDNSNSPYTLNIDLSGNLSVNDNKNVTVWETKTSGIAPFALKLQDNCNLELYDSQINKLWDTNTSGKNN
jgi:hypothetical protein